MEKIFNNFNSRLPVMIEDKAVLFNENGFEVLKNIKDKSIDMIFADPPYFLSGDGITCSGGKMVSVKKGDWDKKMSVDDIYSFNKEWLHEAYRILKDTGTIWVSGTMHNIYTIGMVMQQLGFRILNNITWQKTNPPPNLACKTFTHSTETILWATKANSKKYIFNYEKMKLINNGKQMKDVWSGSLTKPSEKKFGKHPTQKPEYLLDLIIKASTNKDSIVLDPFLGSGTTGVVSLKNNCKFIGIELDANFFNLACERIGSVNNE